MLREITIVRQDKPDLRRRWFRSDYFDLFTWQALDGGAFRMFQLCYDIEREESALVWVLGRGFFHDGVDHDGYDGPTQRAPILVSGAGRSTAGLRARFERESARLDPALVAFVLARIDEYEVLNPKPVSRRTRFRREDWQLAEPDRTAQIPD